jgi:hypothetical protein
MIGFSEMAHRIAVLEVKADENEARCKELQRTVADYQAITSAQEKAMRKLLANNQWEDVARKQEEQLKQSRSKDDCTEHCLRMKGFLHGANGQKDELDKLVKMMYEALDELKNGLLSDIECTISSLEMELQSANAVLREFES